MPKTLNIFDAKSLKEHCDVLDNDCWIFRGMKSNEGEPKIRFAGKVVNFSKLTPYLLGLCEFDKNLLWKANCVTKNCANLAHRSPVSRVGKHYEKVQVHKIKEYKTMTSKAYASVWDFANDIKQTTRWKIKSISFN